VSAVPIGSSRITSTSAACSFSGATASVSSSLAIPRFLADGWAGLLNDPSGIINQLFGSMSVAVDEKWRILGAMVRFWLTTPYFFLVS